MEKYLAKVSVKAKDLFGATVEIPFMAELISNGNFLVYGDHSVICAIGSQFCREKLSYNTDGNGIERAKIENYLFNDERVRHWYTTQYEYDITGAVTKENRVVVSGRFSPEEINYIKAKWGKYLYTNTFVFNDLFYTAPIEDIRDIYNYLVSNTIHDGK